MDGLLCIDKPAGISTFGVVRRVKTLLQERHAGHTGTLDPAATGVVVVALGLCTRLIPYLPLEPKRYEFDIRFGYETNTLDETGEQTERAETRPGEQDVREMLPRFTGAVTQTPPRYSAVKINGIRAYTRARRDEKFETKPRAVQIHALQLLAFDAAQSIARCRLSCAGGTYVRSLAADIGRALGTRAHAAGIRRIGAGGFSVEGAISLSASSAQLGSAVMSPYTAFEQHPRLTLDCHQIRELAHGRRIRHSAERCIAPVLGFAPDHTPVAVLQWHPDGWYHPIRVFADTQERKGRQ